MILSLACCTVHGNMGGGGRWLRRRRLGGAVVWLRNRIPLQPPPAPRPAPPARPPALGPVVEGGREWLASPRAPHSAAAGEGTGGSAEGGAE